MLNIDPLYDPYPSRRSADLAAYKPEWVEPIGVNYRGTCTADSEGNMVSFIQSNYMGFGSGLVVPGTGIALQNRGPNLTLDPNHSNCLEPGKKSYHTIIPGFLTRGGQPVGPFGVMGGFMQPRGHVQVVMNTVDFHLHPQAGTGRSAMAVDGEENDRVGEYDPDPHRGRACPQGPRCKMGARLRQLRTRPNHLAAGQRRAGRGDGSADGRACRFLVKRTV